MTGEFVLAVQMEFKSVEDRDEFIGIWKTLAEKVEASEPDTLCFELLVADTSDTKIMVYERFASKEAFTEVHRTTPFYLEFKEKQGAWREAHGVTVTGQSYFTSGVGYFKRK